MAKNNSKNKGNQLGKLVKQNKGNAPKTKKPTEASTSSPEQPRVQVRVIVNTAPVAPEPSTSTVVAPVHADPVARVQNSTSANIGWLYYKDYYNRINTANIAASDFSESNEAVVAAQLSKEIKEANKKMYKGIAGIEQFSLETTYPGLITGIGISHASNIKDSHEVKFGLQFDHTTGAPVILGSSIKGALSSAFDHPAYIAELCGVEADKVPELQKLIFGEGHEEEGLEAAQRDIFLDALVVSYIPGKLIGTDFITPHEDELKDPTPIQFFKVMPGVVFQFSFVLKESTLKDGTVVDAAAKLKLFKQIILDLGLGAKTNVGYGQFKPLDE